MAEPGAEQESDYNLHAEWIDEPEEEALAFFRQVRAVLGEGSDADGAVDERESGEANPSAHPVGGSPQRSESMSTSDTGSILTPRFDRALTYASELHRTQTRKGT